MSKFVEQFLKVMIVFLIFIGIFIYFSCENSSGCENNCNTSEDDTITQKYLDSSHEEAIAQQQELFDFYNKQKNLTEENKKLHEIIKDQQIALEEKQITAPIVPTEPKKETTVKNVEQVAQQVVKETARVVKKTDREVRRILKF